MYQASSLVKCVTWPGVTIINCNYFGLHLPSGGPFLMMGWQPPRGSQGSPSNGSTLLPFDKICCLPPAQPPLWSSPCLGSQSSASSPWGSRWAAGPRQVWVGPWVTGIKSDGGAGVGGPPSPQWLWHRWLFCADTCLQTQVIWQIL